MVLKVVLDVLKPHDPNIASFSELLAELDGVEGVNVSLYEIDKEVENVKVTVKGDLDFRDLKRKVEGVGASVHSVDAASAGDEIIEEVEILEERVKNNLS